MAIAPSIHVQVLLVQVALLLVTVIGHVVLPRPRVRAREAALHLDELPVIQEVLRPSEVHLNPEVHHQLALLPRDGLMVRHLDRAGLFVRQRMRNQLHQQIEVRASLAPGANRRAKDPPVDPEGLELVREWRVVISY